MTSSRSAPTQSAGSAAHTYAGAYYDDQPLYFNWLSQNAGSLNALNYTVHAEVTGTGGSIFDWTGINTPALGSTMLTTDQVVGPLSAGSHTFKLWLDYPGNGVVNEFMETNNYYERTITVLARPTGQIQGSKWDDYDADGARDVGEPGLADWTIYLDLNANGAHDPTEPSDLTDANGDYAITGLAAGTYFVAEEMPATWHQSYPSATGGQSAAAAVPDTRSVTVTPGGTITFMVQNSPPTRPAGFGAQEITLLPQSAVMLNEVPTSTWTYGCSATSAGMLFGYYDRHGYPNIYTGSANGGVAPLTNLGQGDDPANPISGASSLIATQNGFDGRTTPGHVDDYWIDYNYGGPDPWTYSGPEHTWGLCTADYMGTNQWKWDFDEDGTVEYNVDGATAFFYDTSGAPVNDPIPPAADGLPQTELCHGMRLFAESRGYSVLQNFTQVIDTLASGGFSLAQYRAEIDAARPVLIQLDGHTMVGVGYDSGSQTIYVHDTWDNAVHTMTWGGSYSGMSQVAVTVIHLAPPPNLPGTHTVVLANGEVATGRNFGNYKDAELHGTTFNDLDGDGTKDAGESVSSGWTVYIDANGNGSLDGNETSQVTGPTGTYAFTALKPGTYTLRQIDQAGWVRTAPASGSYTQLLRSGQVASALDFGNRQPPAIIYVDDSATGANNGTSWANAFSSLQTALDTASPNWQVLVAGGIYRPTGGTDRTVSFSLKSGVRRPSAAMPVWPIHPIQTCATTRCTHPSSAETSAPRPTTATTATTSSTHPWPAATAILDGFTVIDGNANGATASEQDRGGGLYTKLGGATVRRCLFIANAASATGNYGYGAAVYADSAVLDISDSSFTSNLATHFGGAVCNMNATLTLTDCSFTSNSANLGGGLYTSGTPAPTLRRCTFTGNSATSEGGAILNNIGATAIFDSTFRANTSNRGGAIYNLQGASGPITRCTFTANTATDLGGAIFNDEQSDSRITNCTFAANSAAQGGAIQFYYYGGPRLANCTFIANIATVQGGAVAVRFGSSPRFYNCTFTANQAPSGAAIDLTNNCSALLYNCILWADAGGEIHTLGTPDSTADATYSDIQGGYAGAGNIDADPRFVRVPSPGLDTLWQTSDDDYGDFRVQAMSPVIDAAGNADVSADSSDLDADGNTSEPLPFDAAGRARFADVQAVADTGAGSAPIVDMGAHEAIEQVVTGTAATDVFYVCLNAAQTQVCVWRNADPAGSPTAAFPLDSFTVLSILGAGGTDSLTLDACNETPLPAGGAFYSAAADGALSLSGLDIADRLVVQTDRLLLNGRAVVRATASGLSLSNAAGAVHLASLSIADGARLTIPLGGKALVTKSLSIAPAGRLDLTDNDLIVSNTTAAAIKSQIHSACNGGVWDGPGISSSLITGACHGLAYAAGDDPAVATLAGHLGAEPFAPTDVIVMRTFLGDANFSGSADFADLGLVLTHYDQPADWTGGNFNYDATVAFADLGLLLNNYNSGGLAPGSTSVGTSVASRPAVRVAAAGATTTLLKSGRGVVDFGTAAIASGKASGPRRTFTVTNSGPGPLAAQLRKLPKGFQLVEPLSTVLMPGQSDTFTVRMTVAAAARHAGKSIRINTNDPAHRLFDIPVRGTVQPRVSRFPASPSRSDAAPALSPLFSRVPVTAVTDESDTDLLNRATAPAFS